MYRFFFKKFLLLHIMSLPIYLSHDAHHWHTLRYVDEKQRDLRGIQKGNIMLYYVNTYIYGASIIIIVGIIYAPTTEGFTGRRGSRVGRARSPRNRSSINVIARASRPARGQSPRWRERARARSNPYSRRRIRCTRVTDTWNRVPYVGGGESSSFLLSLTLCHYNISHTLCSSSLSPTLPLITLTLSFYPRALKTYVNDSDSRP